MPPESLDMQYQQLDTKYEDEIGEIEDKPILDEKLFDINDPRNEGRLSELYRKGGQKELDNQECLVPYSNITSKRQLLLK